MADRGIPGLITQTDVQIKPNNNRQITGTILNGYQKDLIDTLRNGGNLDPKSINTTQLADRAVKTSQIGTAAVTNDKLAADTIVRTFAGAAFLNPFAANKSPRRIGDFAINTASGEIWQSTDITNVPASWNRISAGYYNGQIITNWNTNILSGDITSYGSATGAPTSAESFYGHHINSNVGTANAVQWAIGYTTHKIYIRTKTASTWGAWSIGITAVELGYLSGVTSNIQSQIDGIETNIAPEWVANTPYAWYDFVRHNKILYMCISPNSDATWIEGHWLAKDVGQILTSNYQDSDAISSHLSETATALDTTVDNFAASWRSNSSYVIGELVIREYELYRCKTANNDSVWTPSKWTRVSIEGVTSNIQSQIDGVKTNIAPEWVANTSYTGYDFVMHNNLLYMCISTHSDATWIEGHWLAKGVGKALTSHYQDHDALSFHLSDTAVALDTTVDNFAAPWRSNSSYVIGELVIREYKLYRCKTANSDSVWTPSKWAQISIWQYIDCEIIFESTEVKESILPNVLNKWGNIESLTINSFQGAQEGYVNEYMLEFTVSEDDFTLTLPEGVRWIEEPTWGNGYTYQVSIVNNLAVFAGWEA